MIKQMEIWDFESHQHTLVDDIDSGLNFIVGESNSGKSSIIRALRLVAYNQFDPRSVRVGATHCRVKVTTEKGYVDVKRGAKHNQWEVCKTGEEPEYLDKVGRAAVPQAVEILGLAMVKLGDTDVPVNIMDQLETHFMLDSVGDKDASGSMRAQIVDEISGLSGIEGVIRAVGLDLSRAVREVNELEERINETTKKMHDPALLDAEVRTVDMAQAVVADAARAEGVGRSAIVCVHDHTRVAGELAAGEHRLRDIPNIDHVRQVLPMIGDFAKDCVAASGLYDSYGRVSGDLKVANGRLADIPDIGWAGSTADGARVFAETCKAGVALLEQHGKSKKMLESAEAESADCQRRYRAGDSLTGLDAVLNQIRSAADITSSIGRLQSNLDKAVVELGKTDTAVVAAKEEVGRIMKTVKVCPLTLAAVSGECLKAANGGSV